MSGEINWSRIIDLMHVSIAGGRLSSEEVEECGDAYRAEPDRYKKEHAKAKEEEMDRVRGGWRLS